METIKKIELNVGLNLHKRYYVQIVKDNEKYRIHGIVNAKKLIRELFSRTMHLKKNDSTVVEFATINNTPWILRLEHKQRILNMELYRVDPEDITNMSCRFTWHGQKEELMAAISDLSAQFIRLNKEEREVHNARA